MEIIDKHLDIYQFSLVLFGSITLVFFAYLYWYAISLQEAIIKEKASKQQLLKIEMDRKLLI